MITLEAPKKAFADAVTSMSRNQILIAEEALRIADNRPNTSEEDHAFVSRLAEHHDFDTLTIICCSKDTLDTSVPMLNALRGF